MPWSAVGDIVPEPVAVKVLFKLEDSFHEQAQMSQPLPMEIKVLTELADCPGIVELLSWTEGLFDAHLVFPLFPEDLHTYIRRGALKIGGSGNFDKLPGICKQLFLIGLSHMHNLRILHRDLKPLNMLVNDRASAVGDIDPSAVGDLSPLSSPLMLEEQSRWALRCRQRIDLIHAIVYCCRAAGA